MGTAFVSCRIHSSIGVTGVVIACSSGARECVRLSVRQKDMWLIRDKGTAGNVDLLLHLHLCLLKHTSIPLPVDYDITLYSTAPVSLSFLHNTHMDNLTLFWQEKCIQSFARDNMRYEELCCFQAEAGVIYDESSGSLV